MSHFTNILWKKILSGVLVFLFVALPVLTAHPTQSRANLPVIDASNLIPNILSGIENTLTAASSGISATANSLSASTLNMLGIKEFTLDGIAWALAKKVVEEVARSTVSWINSGFKGSPMFVTDPGAFLLGIADQAAGEILSGSNLKFLCSPINIQIVVNLSYEAQRNKSLKCSLSKAVGNVQGFLNGNFASGGWPGFLSVSLNPLNSNLGAAIATQAMVNSNIEINQSTNVMKWDWGKGFLSSEKCTGTGAAKTCVTTTPGDTIANALNFQLTTGQRSLIEAHQINEIIGALFAQMVKQGLTAASGVFGLSSSGSGASGSGSGNSYVPYSAAAGTGACASLSYIDQLNTPGCDPANNPAPTIGGANSGTGVIFAAITDERSFQAMHQRIVAATTNIIAEAQRRAASTTINDGVIHEAMQIRDTASSTILASQKNILDLFALAAKYDAGSDQDKLDILTAVTSMSTSGVLHTAITNATELTHVNDTMGYLQGIGLPGEQPLNSRIKDAPVIADPSTSGGGSDGGGGGG